MATTVKETSLKTKLTDILVDISWAKVSKKYFGKSSSWIYHKLDGIDGNGSEKGFTEKEKEQFKNALLDLSQRIQVCAEKL
ncbi:MAG: DUF5053 domain-containing protein [Polaribacter sp.]